MGFLDSLLGEEDNREVKSFAKKEKPAEVSQNMKGLPHVPLSVSSSFFPLRLSAMKSNSVNLVVKVKNIANENQLVSVDALVHKKGLLGFDPTGINKSVEKRVGPVAPGASVEVAIPLWANNQTPAGDYEVSVQVFSHYQDYNKVFSKIKRSTSVRVV
jgi:uncharacterized membrane protein